MISHKTEKEREEMRNKWRTPEMRELCQKKTQEVWDNKEKWMLNAKGWNLIKEIEGCKLYVRLTEMNSYKMIRCERTIKTKKSAADFIKLVYEKPGKAEFTKENRKEFDIYDPGNIFYLQLCPLDEQMNSDICHVFQKSNSWIFWSRDFIIARDTKYEGNICWTYGQSIDTNDNHIHSQFRASKSVRGYVRWLYRAEKKENDELHIVYYMHGDPHGWVPSVLFNFALYQKAYEVLRVSKMFLGEGVNNIDKVIKSVL